MRLKDKLVLVGIIFFILGSSIGFAIGYQVGSFQSLNWVVEQALVLMDRDGMTIDIDSKLIATGLKIWRAKAEVFIKGDRYQPLNITI